VLLVAGSDAGIFTNSPGRSLIDELELLVEAGLSPYRALRSATYTAARVLGETDRGCLDPGCVADLVLYACDPLQALACLATPQTVIRQGRVYDHAALSALKDQAASQDVARTLDHLRAGLAAQGGDSSVVDALASDPRPPGD